MTRCDTLWDNSSPEIRQYAQDVQTNPVLAFKPWSKQLAFLRAQQETRLLAWSNRSGKTAVAAAECVLAAQGIHPYQKYPKPPLTVWAVSSTLIQMRDSIIPTLEGDASHPRLLPPGVELNQQRSEYEFANGSIIRLKSAEQGRESFQGAGIPLIWLDEDIDPDVLKEIFIRIGAGFRRRIVWTLTAINGLNYAYNVFYEPWRNAGGKHPKIYCSEASMDESPYLDKEEIDGLLRFYPPGSR